MIVMSIHQPCYSIFRLCDHITLMSQGNVIYAGARRDTLLYFTDVLGKSQCLCVAIYLIMYTNVLLYTVYNRKYSLSYC